MIYQPISKILLRYGVQSLGPISSTRLQLIANVFCCSLVFMKDKQICLSLLELILEHIIGHIPPGLCLSSCSWNFYHITNRKLHWLLQLTDAVSQVLGNGAVQTKQQWALLLHLLLFMGKDTGICLLSKTFCWQLQTVDCKVELTLYLMLVYKCHMSIVTAISYCLKVQYVKFGLNFS